MVDAYGNLHHQLALSDRDVNLWLEALFRELREFDTGRQYAFGYLLPSRQLRTAISQLVNMDYQFSGAVS